MSPEYDLCVRLRQEILREPLHLVFTESELEKENIEFHFGVFNLKNTLLGCLSLKPIDAGIIKMRQVAIDEDQQGKGIGKYLVKETEQWALSQNYKTIILHARESAISFYEKLDYLKEGDMFKEVNLPHWTMNKNL